MGGGGFGVVYHSALCVDCVLCRNTANEQQMLVESLEDAGKAIRIRVYPVHTPFASLHFTSLQFIDVNGLDGIGCVCESRPQSIGCAF